MKIPMLFSFALCVKINLSENNLSRKVYQVCIWNLTTQNRVATPWLHENKTKQKLVKQSSIMNQKILSQIRNEEDCFSSSSISCFLLSSEVLPIYLFTYLSIYVSIYIPALLRYNWHGFLLFILKSCVLLPGQLAYS